MKNIATFSDRNRIALLTLAGLAFCLSRLPGLSFVENSLWAEDGSLFLSAALRDGVFTLFTPYGGYLHLYPRLVALIFSFVSIELTPYLYFFAWMVPCGFLAYVIARRLDTTKASIVCVAIFFTFLQPNSGDIFYNITNAQWFICAAASIWVLLSGDVKPRYMEMAALIVAFLTGPFVVLLLPVAAAKLVFEPSARKNKSLYIAMAVCAAIQLFTVVGSNRITSITADTNIHDWIRPIAIYLSFGVWPAKKMLALIALVPWAVIALFLLSDVNNSGRKNVFYLLLASTIIFAAGLVAKRDDPLALHPYVDGSRYYFVPYTLVTIATFIAVSESISKLMISCIALSFSASLGLSSVNKPDMHWKAYVSFAQTIPDIKIPINPEIMAYPPWHVEVPRRWLRESHTVDVVDAITKGRVNVLSFDGNSYVPANENSYLLYSLPERCLNKKYIAFGADVKKPKAGLTKFFWKGVTHDYTEEYMSRLFLPAGKTDIFFAVENDGITELRLDTMNAAMPYSVEKPRIFCKD